MSITLILLKRGLDVSEKYDLYKKISGNNIYYKFVYNDKIKIICLKERLVLNIKY